MAIVLPNRTTAPPTREAGLVQSPLSVVVRRTAPAAHVRHCDAPVALDGNTGRGWHRGRTVGQPDATGWRPSGAAALLCGRPPLREAGLVQSPLSVVVRRTAPAAHVRHCDAPVALDGNTGRGWHRGQCCHPG